MENYAEKAAFGMGFSRTEMIETSVGNVRTKTIYAGHAPLPQVTEATLANAGWSIRKTVVTEDIDNATTLVIEMWGSGSWIDRESINYEYR